MKLYFDEAKHTYTDDLGNPYISTTTILHDYIPEFDKKYWLERKAKELGITEAVLDKQWEAINTESKERGNGTHNYLEDGIKEHSKFFEAIRYLKRREANQMVTFYDLVDINNHVKPLDIDKFIDATDNRYPGIYTVFQWLVDNGYKIYSEIGAFLPNLLLSGTVDVPAIREEDFIVLDWKTNKDGLHFDAGYYRKDKTSMPHQLTSEWVHVERYMNPPLSNLQDCKGNHYGMQLSIYAYMMEQILRRPCRAIRLGHIGSPFVLNKYGMPLADERGMYTIDPDGVEVVQWHPLTYLRNEVNRVMEDRKLKLNNNVNREYKLFPTDRVAPPTPSTLN
jgi:ATP-dependent exoDNAse (exonuclease V) beta subunit